MSCERKRSQALCCCHGDQNPDAVAAVGASGRSTSVCSSEEKEGEKTPLPPVSTLPATSKASGSSAAPSALWVGAEATWRTRSVCFFFRERERDWKKGGEGGGYRGIPGKIGREGETGWGCCYTEELAGESRARPIAEQLFIMHIK